MCAHTKKPCSTHLPIKDNKYVNTLLLRVNSVIDLSRNYVLSIMGDGLVNWAKNSLTNDYMSLAAEVNDSQGLSAIMSDELINMSSLTEDHVSLSEPRYNFYTNSSSCINESAICNGEGLSTVGLEDSHFLLDELMITAYGDKLLYCDGGPLDSLWY